MCLAVFSWQPQSQYPLTVVANRDEFRARPTQAMHWWSNEILAGKDLQAGGTWLGLNRQNKFALLTNIRPGYIGMKRELSRGELVTKFLSSECSIETFHESITPKINDYAGFNLLLCDGKRLFWFSSTNPSGRFLNPGIYGLSNDALDTPWPKLNEAKQQLHDQLPKVQNTLTAHSVLCSTEPAPKEQLPNTGVPIEWEAKLSSQCILGEEYGTRCRSHIVQDATGLTRVCEQQIDLNGNITHTNQWAF
ncbi:NRDE family protein [Reinekea marina]|uniref:NRDE family protein n=1 Tax=Reinekea marina TaxID=1310421 RepID=A0ABV7WX24_9GAMM|nr:NRDE family protein [Reinekea marina]MDN3650186.1 NRDE family protein [Reinekea marina]